MDAAEAALRRHYPDAAARWYMPMKIGGAAETADAGAGLILAGVKTATSAALWEIGDGRPPFAGALSVLLDGSDRPRAVLETERVARLPFRALGPAFAAAYGEGERTLAWWRREIGGYYRAGAAERGLQFRDTDILICEWFRVVRRLDQPD